MSGNTKLAITGAAVVACATGLAGVPALRAQETIELPAEDRWLDADLEELYRVGSLLGDAWDTFGSVAAVDFDGSGNLYILDGQAKQITVVDLQGNLVRQFGRVGEGLGEFTESVWAFSLGSDERLVVYDGDKRAFVLFGSDGEFEREMPLAGPRFISIPALQAYPFSRSVVSTGDVPDGWADRRRAELESMEFHHEIPVVRDLRTSRDGTIWSRLWRGTIWTCRRSW